MMLVTVVSIVGLSTLFPDQLMLGMEIRDKVKPARSLNPRERLDR